LVIVSVATRSVAAGTSPATVGFAENKSTSTGGNLWAPFGLHTDDLDAMVKRRNIRALVMINPIGFFYENLKPMGIMYEALSALQTYVNQKFKTGAVKVEISFIPVRPDQVETALTQGAGDFVAYALVVTPDTRGNSRLPLRFPWKQMPSRLSSQGRISAPLPAWTISAAKRFTQIPKRCSISCCSK
jgi:hypothetical protein